MKSEGEKMNVYCLVCGGKLKYLGSKVGSGDYHSDGALAYVQRFFYCTVCTRIFAWDSEYGLKSNFPIPSWVWEVAEKKK